MTGVTPAEPQTANIETCIAFLEFRPNDLVTAARAELAALLADNARLRKIADATRAWHDARVTAVANCFADLQIGPAYRVQHEGPPTAQEVLADACGSLSAALAEPPLD